MIRAIVFDCFGVLNADGWLPFKSKYFGHDEKLMLQAKDLNGQADSGLINYDDFITAVAKLANLTFDEAYQEIENNVSNHVLIDYIKKLKPNYKIGMLSNAADNWLSEMFTMQQLQLFDAIALSFETGYIKPQPEAYHNIADKLGVRLDECVLLDDQERYCNAAEDIGMKAVVFKTNQQAIADIDKILTNAQGD